MFELFDSLDEDENNRLNEIEKNFQYLNEQNSDVSSKIYDNSRLFLSRQYSMFSALADIPCWQ